MSRHVPVLLPLLGPILAAQEPDPTADLDRTFAAGGDLVELLWRRDDNGDLCWSATGDAGYRPLIAAPVGHRRRLSRRAPDSQGIRGICPGPQPSRAGPAFILERVMTRRIEVRTRGRGLHDITADVAAAVRAEKRDSGLCTLFIRHTSASLLIQENADPAVQRDLEAWFDRLVPDGDALFTHVDEGADDMPGHVRAALLAVSISIPVVRGELALGTWQGIYLFEHRRTGRAREVLVHVSG
jgi:secondary thiamine-phosphate synthase enzyme